MSLFVVRKRNPYLSPGTWVECFDDGCQKAKVETQNNRMKIVGHEGLLIPESLLRPFMMRPIKHGLDKWSDK